LHVDLKRIDLSKRLRVAVPVVTQGDAKGVKQQGGLLELVTRSVEIECVPEHIPDKFVVDVSEMMLGDARRASDLPLAEGVKLLSPSDAVLVHVVGMKAEEVAPVVEVAPVAAEPEVVKKGKKEEAAPVAEEKGKKK
jgi:large subunit ribosomal protein L25